MLPEPRQPVEIAIGLESIAKGRVIFARGGTLLVHVEDQTGDPVRAPGESAVVIYGQFWLSGTVRAALNGALTIDFDGEPARREPEPEPEPSDETHDEPPFEPISDERQQLLPEPRRRVEIECGDWGVVPARALDVRGGVLRVLADHDPHDLRRMAGAAVLVMYGRAGGQYRLRATVRRLDEHELTLECEGEPERHQRREFVRVPLHVPVRVARATGGFPEPRDTCDLSGGGMRLSGSDGMRVDDVIGLELDLPDGRPPVPAHARVVRLDSKTVSLAFVRIAEAHRDRVIKLVFEQQRKTAGVRFG